MHFSLLWFQVGYTQEDRWVTYEIRKELASLALAYGSSLRIL
jgi:hypothetical protein